MVEPLEPLGDPARHRRAGLCRKSFDRLEVLHRDDAGATVFERRHATEQEVGERGAGLHLWNSPNNLIEDTIRRLFELRGIAVQELVGN